MGRKLSKNEKRLLILLFAAIAAVAYYYLFWNNITQKIASDQGEITQRQPVYDDYKSKINALPDLKTQLQAIQNQPSHKEKFFTADENQEVYMDFLQKLMDDNELTVDSIAFAKTRVELPAAAIPASTPAAAPASQSGNTQAAAAPAPAAASAAASIPAGQRPYLNVTTATMSFSVDFDKPQNLLNMLDAIETSEKMVVIDNLQLNIGTNSHSITNTGAAAQGANKPSKIYQCNTTINFVSLVFPAGQTPTPAPGAAGSAGVSASPTAAAVPAGNTLHDDSVVEVPVAAANP